MSGFTANPEETTLDWDGWDELLDYVAEGRVVPVVGSELLELPGPRGPTTLDALLAEDLAERLKVCPRGSDPPSSVAEVAFRFVRGGGAGLDIYSGLLRAYSELQPALPQPLRQLAQITDFCLLLSTTSDRLLADAMDAERFDGAAGTLRLAFYPRAPRERRDLPRPLEEIRQPVVFQLFGEVAASPDYVVTDEDVLEFVCALHGEKAQPSELFRALRESHLLFLGCRFPDWLARFFVRTVVGQRLEDDRRRRKFFADAEVRADARLAVFLQHYAGELYPPGNPVEFVAELHRRWQAQRQARVITGATGHSTLEPADMASLSIFLSYGREDQLAAVRLCQALRQGGLDVWMDEERIDPGDAWDRKIRRHIRDCALFVPILSQRVAARREGYFRKEWLWAVERARGLFGSDRPFLVPVCVDDLPRGAAGVPSEFEDPHIVDLPEIAAAQGDRAAAVSELVAKLREMMRAVQLDHQGPI